MARSCSIGGPLLGAGSRLVGFGNRQFLGDALSTHDTAHRTRGSPGKKVHRNGDARLHAMAAHPNGSQMIVESTVKGMYKVPNPRSNSTPQLPYSKVLGTIHRIPGPITFSQIVRIGRFKFL